jgi:hypothetical protein
MWVFEFERVWPCTDADPRMFSCGFVDDRAGPDVRGGKKDGVDVGGAEFGPAYCVGFEFERGGGGGELGGRE